jgi:hypothetical protein
MEITLHEHRGLGGGGETLHGFKIAVGSGGEGVFDFCIDKIGEFLYANDEGNIDHATFYGEIALSESRATGGSGGFDAGGFDADQPAKIGDECAKMRLPRKVGCEHIADEKGLGAQPARIFDSGFEGEMSQLTDGELPMFADRCLSDTGDNDIVCHKGFTLSFEWDVDLRRLGGFSLIFKNLKRF